MSSFGSYETDKEVYSGPAYTVYSARKTGDAKTEYAIKVFSLFPGGLDTESSNELFPLITDIEESCVERIAVQQKAAEASPLVAPILESGRDDRGVWYVTRFYPRSVNRIITGRVALSREALHHILRAIAQGALDIKRICGRSHGEILPSNVQISRSEKLSEAEVVLSDPLPGGEAESERYERGDLHAIGQILLQLVRQKEITDEHEFLILPILVSPEWTKLFGKDADRWLALCNRLLDPELSPATYSLENLTAELDSLQPKPPVSRRTLAVAVAAVVVLAITGVFVMRHFSRGSLVLTSDPPGADIQMEENGTFHSIGKTPLRSTVVKGDHSLRAEFPGLQPQAIVLPVPGGGSATHQFDFAYGRVQITSDPANAEVILDGAVVGHTPFTSQYLGAEQTTNYALNLNGYQLATLTVNVRTNRLTTNYAAKLVPNRPGDVAVEVVSVFNNVIIREGTNSWQTPLPKPIQLAPGPHVITADYPDFPTLSTNVQVVTGTPVKVEFAFPYGTARLDVRPVDAAVLIDGKPLKTDETRKFLPPGDHAIQVQRTDYKTHTTNFSVATGRYTDLTIQLEPFLASLTFVSIPEGARVFLSGTPEVTVGETKGRLLKTNLKAGTYSFIARYDGLDPVTSGSLTVSNGQSTNLSFDFKFSALHIDSDPPGAEVVVAGKTGKTPFDLIQKPAQGPAPIAYQLKLADYDPVSESVELTAGRTNQVRKALSPMKVPLALSSDPPGAQFSLADTTAGSVLTGSNNNFLLPWGTHTIVARLPALAGLPGPDAKTESVQVDKGGKTAKKFEFAYASLRITNEEPDAVLMYQGKSITNLPALLYLKPDIQYDFRIQMGEDFQTNLPPVKLAAANSFTPPLRLPEAVKPYTNSIGMVLMRVGPNMFVGQFEVTVKQYGEMMSQTFDPKDADLPAVLVTLPDAQVFCNKLTALANESKALQEHKLAGWKYALPTEAEWRAYAEPSATSEVLAESVFGTSSVPVDLKRKSAGKLGIYDIFGNVAEWCLGANNEGVSMGGSASNRRPTNFAAALLLRRTSQQMRDPSKPTEEPSTRNLGFRCILKRP